MIQCDLPKPRPDSDPNRNKTRPDSDPNADQDHLDRQADSDPNRAKRASNYCPPNDVRRLVMGECTRIQERHQRCFGHLLFVRSMSGSALRGSISAFTTRFVCGT